MARAKSTPASMGKMARALCIAGVAVSFAVAFTFTVERATAENLTGLYDAKTGYRLKHYRSAVPDDVPGGTRIYIDDIDALRKTDNAILVDVMPSTGFSYHPETGHWRLSKVHDHIAGSTWLPDVGKGRVTAELEAYFKANLTRLTQGDKTRPLIIYCQSDCWMAWNAVQRAASYGYTKLYWYPEGIDGWRDYDRPLVKASPVPVDITAISDEPAARSQGQSSQVVRPAGQ
ncbi:MAG: rhodanese-like domain-containing protein [Pseudomonadota bacterium]